MRLTLDPKCPTAQTVTLKSPFYLHKKFVEFVKYGTYAMLFDVKMRTQRYAPFLYLDPKKVLPKSFYPK